MSIDFAYAQARAQARLGERLPEAGWRVLESTLGLPQYLVSARHTVLAPLVRYFSAAVTTHTIERTLRDNWRAEVAAVNRWVPEAWAPAVEWTAWLPYLDAVAWLMRGQPPPAWMEKDAVLNDLAIHAIDVRRHAIAESPFGILADGNGSENLQASWFERWTRLRPATSGSARAGMQALVAAVTQYRAAIDRRGASRAERADARGQLGARAMSLMHRHIQEPVVVFSHLVLVALDLQRLRDGLLRRTVFGDEFEEQAA